MGIFNKGNNNVLNQADVRQQFKNSIFILKKNETVGAKLVLGKNISLNGDQEIEISYEDLFDILNKRNRALKQMFEQEKIIIQDIILSSNSTLEYDNISLEHLRVALLLNHCCVNSEKYKEFSYILSNKCDINEFKNKINELDNSDKEMLIGMALNLYNQDKLNDLFKINVLENLKMSRIGIFEDYKRGFNFVRNNEWNNI